MYQSNAYPHLVCQFSDSDTTVLHEQSPHLVDDIVISASWGPTMTWFTVHWCAASFEAVVPLFYSCDTHGIVPESLLNLSNSFHLGIAKLFAKFDAIPLLKSFRHFAIIDNLTSVHNTYTIIDWLPAPDAFYRREKIHACAEMSPPHLQWWTLPVLDLFMREKLRSHTFWTDLVFLSFFF